MSEEAAAMTAAIKYLSRNERFEGEVRAHLDQFETEVIDAVIANLLRRHIIDDSRTLESYIRAHSGRKAIGKHRMEFELRGRRADQDTVNRRLSEISENDLAAQALQGKLRPDPALAEKGFRFLISRGFSYESANIAIRNYFDRDV